MSRSTDGPHTARALLVRPGPRRIALLLALLLALGGFAGLFDVGLFGARDAAAANGMTVEKSSDGDPLIGGTIVYTITVTNNSFPAGLNNPDGKAYNLEISDTLPPGETFVSSPAGTPEITTSGGQQTLTWSNLTDVARGQTYTLEFTATLAGSPGVTVPGTSITNTATATVSDNPRADASTDAGTSTVTNTALPFKLEKETNQSTGVHQATGGCGGVGSGRGFSYDLIATNNTIAPTNNVTVTDILPYGVEYCGTSGGGFTPAVTNNADGTTTLVYNLGTLAAGQVVTVSPNVAIPYVYPAGPQAGQFIADGTTFTNNASMSGTYSGDGQTYNTDIVPSTVTAKYSTIDKTGTPESVTYGDTITYTLTISASSNYNINNEYVVDIVPDGVDYDLGSASVAPAAIPLANYLPCAGNTSPAPGVYLCPDGTTALTFGPLAGTTAGSDVTITFTGTVRETYRSTGAPVFADDELRNQASITYDAASIPLHLTPNSLTGGTDTDDAVSRPGNPATISKTIIGVTRADGTAPPANEGQVVDPKNATLAVGDIVTFQLAYTGSPQADQQNLTITDFLPLGYQYVPGSSVYSGNYTGTINDAALATNPDPECTVTPCAANRELLWRITGTGGDNVFGQGQNLTIQFQAHLHTGTAGIVGQNLVKFTEVNSAGFSFSGRDQADVTALAPNLTMAKTNDAPNPVLGDQIFNYTVMIANSGTSTAYRIADIVDTLPPDVRYLSTVSITPPGAVGTAVYAPGGGGFGGTLTFPGVAPIAPSGSVSITYQVQLQPVPANATVETNTARIASYSSQPSGDIAGTYGPLQASSTIRIGGQALEKRATIHQPQVNGPGGPVTIGDQVDYIVTLTLPGNVTVANGQMRECLPLGFHYVPGSYSAAILGQRPPNITFPAVDTDPGFSAGNDGSDPCPADQEYVLISLGGAEEPLEFSTRMEVRLSAVITGLDQDGAQRFTIYPGPNNTRSGGAPNTNNVYQFRNTTQISSATTPNNGIDNNVFVPHLTLDKKLARPAAGTAVGGETVDFLITLSNVGGSPAYDIAPLVDTLDPGLAFVAAYPSDATCQTTGMPLATTQAGQVVTIPVTPGNTPPASLANGTSTYVCLSTTLTTNASPNTTYPNTVAVGAGGVQYYSAPAAYPSRASYSDTPPDDAFVATPDVAVVKSEISGRPSINGVAVPGEVISFQLQFTIPRQTSLFGPVTVTDSYDATRLGTPVDTTAPTPGTLTCAGGLTAPASYTFAAASGTVTYSFGTNLSAGAADAVCTLQFDTRVLNVAANEAGGAISNSFSLAFNSSASTPITVQSPTVDVTILEPSLTLAKTVVSSYDPATGLATFRLTIPMPRARTSPQPTTSRS